MVRFFHNNSAQAEAADMLIFALLVSISVVIMNVGPLTYQNNQQVAVFEDRYIRDYTESSILTMKYAVAGNSIGGESEIKYIIGPPASNDFQGFFGKISDLLSKIGFEDLPIERKVKGSVLNTMADDVVLNIRYDFNGDEDGGFVELSQLMSAGYTKQSEEAIQKTLDTVMGDRFNYFIIVEYSPSEKIHLKKFIYGLRAYTNYKYLKDHRDEWKRKSSNELNDYLNTELKGVRSLKVVDMPLTVSNDPDLLLEILRKGPVMFNDTWEISIGGEFSDVFLNSNKTKIRLDNLNESFFVKVQEEIKMPGNLSTRAKVRIYVWTKA